VSEAIRALKRAQDVAGLSALIPYARLVGLDAFLDEGRVVTVLRFRQTNIGNPQVPALHGGVIGGLMEHAAILHLLAETDIAVVPKIVNLSVDYLRPGRAVDTFARGRVIRQGRRIANVRIEAWQEAPDKPIAAAHAHFLLAAEKTAHRNPA
jgi:uncharacterized protein (TIGR00369 family)